MDVYNSAKGHLPKCISNHFMEGGGGGWFRPPQYQTAPESPILIGLKKYSMFKNSQIDSIYLPHVFLNLIWGFAVTAATKRTARKSFILNKTPAKSSSQVQQCRGCKKWSKYATFFLCITKKSVKNNTEILRCCVTGTGIPLDTAGSHHTLTRGKNI